MCASSHRKRSGSAGCGNTQLSLFDNSVIEHVAANQPALCLSPPTRIKGHIMDARQAKGFALAAHSEITREGNVWLVPSESSSKKYIADLFLQTCTCPDFE